MAELSDLERGILNAVQKNFVACERPFDEMARAVGASSGAEVVSALEKLLGDGYIRRIGPIFDANALGYKSTLAAVNVPAGKIDEAAAIINSYPEVTHNYLRDDDRFNVWFTVTAESQERLEAVLRGISVRVGAPEVLNLPVKKKFKIKVEFEV